MYRCMAPMIASDHRQLAYVFCVYHFSPVGRKMIHTDKKSVAEVSFRDLDAMGHVNNAVYLTYKASSKARLTAPPGRATLARNN
jgi:Acyl-ACP thioesterase C-terminal domain